jgi:hypothetical protein
MAAADFQDLLRHGIGLDDVYRDPDGLRARIVAASPQAICFNSSNSLRRFVGLHRIRQPWRRDAASRYVQFDGVLVWATSDSSFKANAQWPDRLEDLRALRARLGARP